MGYLVDELLEAVRDSAMLPPSEESAQATKLLAMLNREQRLYLTRLILSAREDYQVATHDVTTTAGTVRYALPSGAVASGIKHVEQVTSTGATITLVPWPSERRDERANASGPGDYFFEGNTLVLYADPSVATLRFHYFRRYSQMVLEESAAQVQSFNTGAKTVLLVSVPDDWSGTQSYDFIGGTPPFELQAAAQSASLSTLTLTFSAALPSTLAAGDYVALTGETPICQAPLELHDVLVLRTAYKWLRAKGDPAATAVKTDLDEARADALALLEPRTQGVPRPFINLNAPGWTRFRKLRRGLF